MKTKDNYQKIADFFSQITRFDINIGMADETVSVKCEHLFYPKEIMCYFKELKEKLRVKASMLPQGSFQQELVPVFHVYFLLVRSASDSCCAVIGPFCYKDIPPDTVYRVLRNFGYSLSHLGEFQTWYQFLPRNMRPLQQNVNLILTLFQSGVIEGEAVYPVELPQMRKLPNPPKEEERQNVLRDVFHQYQIEEQLRIAIKNGETQKALQTLSEGNNMFEYRSDGVSMWHIQHMVTVLGTVMRIAAKDGGVSALKLHEISEKYYYKVHNAASGGELLDEVLIKMLKDYSHAVQYAKVENYSDVIEKAVSFLCLNYSKHITIKDIAEFIPCHPTYLCQRFKKETGKTILEALTEIRLEHALLLLKNPDIPITMIHLEIGYESYARFSAVFKKRFGCSCSSWRKRKIPDKKSLAAANHISY